MERIVEMIPQALEKIQAIGEDDERPYAAPRVQAAYQDS